MEHAPVVILARPQLGENIGACARAMRNFGLTEMRIIAPRDGWPNPAALAMASGAVDVIEGAQVFETTEGAVADLTYLYATTSRGREMDKPVLAPAQAASDAASRVGAGGRVGLVFGAEKEGLHNDEIALCDAIVSYPVDPSFPSLNLAQAVLLFAYEVRRAAGFEAPAPVRGPNDARGGVAPKAPRETAAKADLYRFFTHLEEELDARGFYKTPDKRPTMIRNLRSLFSRAELSDQEVRTLRGVIKALTDFPRKDG